MVKNKHTLVEHWLVSPVQVTKAEAHWDTATLDVVTPMCAV